MSSFIAAGTSYAVHGVNMIPFFIFYSMFGLQRIGDLIWAAADSRTRGFLIGATAGRTTLSGEGLQHQDGNSHILALPVPNLKAYDPAFAYEFAVIIKDGMKRMYEKQEDIFYYITAMNESYRMPAMPDGAEEGILKGIYRYSKSSKISDGPKAHLLGSGSILNECIKAAKLLEEKFHIPADVWSVTSYKELYMNATDVERKNLSNPDSKDVPYITSVLAGEKGVFVAASDYIKALPAMISKWIPGRLEILGTDGFGRSDGRKQLREFFEVDYKHIAVAALKSLMKDGCISSEVVSKAIKDLELDPDKPNPVTV